MYSHYMSTSLSPQFDSQILSSSASNPLSKLGLHFSPSMCPGSISQNVKSRTLTTEPCKACPPTFDLLNHTLLDGSWETAVHDLGLTSLFLSQVSCYVLSTGPYAALSVVVHLTQYCIYIFSMPVSHLSP